MALSISPAYQLHSQTTDSLDTFLKLVQEETKKDVNDFLSLYTRTDKEATRCQDSQRDLSKELEDALQERNIVKVWKLIVRANQEGVPETLENLNEVCRTIANKEDMRDNMCCLKYIYLYLEKQLTTLLKHMISWFKLACDEDNIEEETEIRSEKEQTWIKILSNPLYISLEWLWRNNPKSQSKKGIRRKESKLADIIEAALDDAYLLEKIASYEHHYSRDEYMDRAKEYETFAADIVEQISASDLTQLHKIMVIKGEGSRSLSTEPKDFIQSLSLLKMAANKQRKLVRTVRL